MTMTYHKTSTQVQASVSVSYYRCQKCNEEGYIAITGVFEHKKSIGGAEKCPEGGVHDLQLIAPPRI